MMCKKDIYPWKKVFEKKAMKFETNSKRRKKIQKKNNNLIKRIIIKGISILISQEKINEGKLVHTHPH